MLDNHPKIALIYLLYYHNKSYVDDMVSALKKISYPKEKIELIIVSNIHPESGSFIHYIESAVMPLSGTEIPHVTVLAQDTNLGFAKGNNVGVEWAIKNNFDYCVFHNNDGFFASNAFEPLIQAFEKDEKLAIAQSLVMLYPETNLLNSAGNSFHYLGFGFCDNYRTNIDKLNLEEEKEIDYASGAAFMVKTDLIKKYGSWDDDFFLYHEDLEWSFRLRCLGYKIKLIRDSVFYHKYSFGRSIEKFYYMERNRHAIMLMFFKWPTLILLFPMALVLEVGLWIFSFKNKYAKKRWEVYKYWLNRENFKLWYNKRKKIQKNRIVSDRFLLKYSVSEILFQENEMQNPLLKYIGNPIMKIYYLIVVKALIWW
jgi:GT2 family glycosyltransferase